MVSQIFIHPIFAIRRRETQLCYGAYDLEDKEGNLSQWGSLPEHLWLIQEARHKSMVLGYCLPHHQPLSALC